MLTTPYFIKSKRHTLTSLTWVRWPLRTTTGPLQAAVGCKISSDHTHGRRQGQHQDLWGVPTASKNIPETGVVHVFNSQEPNGLGGMSKGWMSGYIPSAAKVDQFHVMLEGPKPTACLCPVTAPRVMTRTSTVGGESCSEKRDAHHDLSGDSPSDVPIQECVQSMPN